MPTQIGANRAGNYIRTPKADTISGIGGNDTLNGEGSTDILTGAGGNDQFLFDTAFPAAGTAGNFSEINVAATSEVVIAGNSVNESVYNSQTGGLFYNPNNNVAGFGLGGSQFATVYSFLTDFSNTAELCSAKL